jgi:hypothetical protein
MPWRGPGEPVMKKTKKTGPSDAFGPKVYLFSFDFFFLLTNFFLLIFRLLVNVVCDGRNQGSQC